MLKLIPSPVPMPSALSRIIFLAFNVASNELAYNLPRQKKKVMYRNVFPANKIDTSDATAHNEVRRPVLTANIMRLLMMVSLLIKPVRDLLRR